MGRPIDADKMLAEESEAYIRAQAKITDKVTSNINYVVHTKLQRLIADTPTLDAVPVVHARWVPTCDTLKKCSNCGYDFAPTSMTNFCPQCGAKMGKDGDFEVILDPEHPLRTVRPAATK